MKQLIKIPAGILAGLVLILITPVQSAFAHSYNPTNPIVFEEKADLIDFHRAGGEGLGGVAWLDYDADGDLDLFLANGFGNKNGLFRNNGDGTFTDVATEAGVANGTGSSGVVVGDIDNDGYPDLFVSGEGFVIGPVQTPAKLYHNKGDGSFEDITIASGVTGAGSALSAAMGDINNDGYLDIFVTSPGHIPFKTGTGTEQSHENKLYLNNGDLTFTDISVAAGVDGLYADPTPGVDRLISDGACVVGFSDYDHDDLLDIVVGNCNGYPLIPSLSPVRPTPFNLFRNNGDLTFTDVAASAGLDIPGFWMGLAFGDFNQDGYIDFAATSTGTFNNFPHILMSNNGDGTFTDIAEDNLSQTPFGWGITTADFDNDGDLDLFKVGSLPLFGAIGPDKGSPGRLFLNKGEQEFVEDPDAVPVDLSFDYTTGLGQADYNNDGFTDLVVMRSPWQTLNAVNPNGHPVFLQNQGNNNHWITVRLTGTTSNRMGIGARIEVFARGMKRQVREVRAGSSFASSETPWPTFGLGKKYYAFIRVNWPSGLTEWFTAFHLRRTYDLVEGHGWFPTYR
jgi:enediyne biosynthesis protein E4